MFSKGVTELEVATHFGMLFGSVNQCKFARNYQGTMLYFGDIAHYQDEKRRQEGKVNRQEFKVFKENIDQTWSLKKHWKSE